MLSDGFVRMSEIVNVISRRIMVKALLGKLQFSRAVTLLYLFYFLPALHLDWGCHSCSGGALHVLKALQYFGERHSVLSSVAFVQ